MFHSRMKKFQNVGKMPLRRLFFIPKKNHWGRRFREGWKTCAACVWLFNKNPQFYLIFSTAKAESKNLFCQSGNSCTHLNIFFMFIELKFCYILRAIFVIFFSFYFRFFFCVIDRIRMRITKWKQWREINCDWSDGFRVLEVTI